MTNANEFSPRILAMIDAFCDFANRTLDADDETRLDRDYFAELHALPDYYSIEMLDTDRFQLHTIDDCRALKFSSYIECDIELIAFFDDDDKMTQLAISTDTSPYTIINF